MGIDKKIINGHKKRANKKVAAWDQANMGLLATCRGESVTERDPVEIK